jgi:hypothetical protein
LTIIESPVAILYEPIQVDDLDPLGLRPDAQPSVEAQQLVTRKIRSTISHLRSRAGFFSCFRGLALYIVTGALVVNLTSFFVALPFVPKPLAAVIAVVLLSTFRMGWTWIVISEPSNKYWFRRLPSTKLWVKVAAPTAVAAICEVVATSIPICAGFLLGINKYNSTLLSNMTRAELSVAGLKSLAVFAIYLLCSVVIVIPSRVSLTRVQASLLPDEDETIVPFDRSFGGRVVPAIVGGSGAIGMLDAWTTFDWNSRIRLLKLYGKIAAIQAGVFTIFFVVIVAELMVSLKPKNPEN